MRKVYVRGVGAVTPLGISWNESKENLHSGQKAIGPVRSFDSQNFPSRVAAEIPPSLFQKLKFHEDRRISLIEKASEEAWQQAEISLADPTRLGVFIGAESGRASFSTVVGLAKSSGSGDKFDHEIFARSAGAYSSKVQFEMVSPAAVASFLAKKFNAHGSCHTVSLACSSAAIAMVEAVRHLRMGVCDTAICGGVGADVDPLMLAGFGKISALSARGESCPFDIQRDGFVVGEGAAIILLSTEKAHSNITVSGAGRTLDAFNLTAPDPEGDGAFRAMKQALSQAQLQHVDYIQAHGTSTVLNDRIEALALHRALGSEIKKAHVSSVKGALGHWIAGAGAIGFLAAHEALASGLMIPTAGLNNPDPSLELNHVQGTAQKKEVHSALVNSFGFGGANASLVLRKEV